jgi:glycosyltransferase involved in cell wall biosynthesis
MTAVPTAPIASIIIPAYNGEKTIAETIESVLNQTLKNIEIIVVNDGSTDKTSEVVRQFSDPRLRLIEQENAGVAAARNHGAAVSQGRYLTFIDADDLWTPEKVEDQVRALEMNPDAGAVYSWIDWVDEEGNYIRDGGFIDTEYNTYLQILLIDIVQSGSNAMIRRDAYFDLGGYEGSLHPAEDWDFWLRLAESYEFICVPKLQVHYRQVRGSASTNALRMERVSLAIINRERDRLSRTPADRKRFAKLLQTTLNNRYKFLLYKAMDGGIHRRRALLAMRYLAYWLWRDNWEFVREHRDWTIKICAKILAFIILPNRLAWKFVYRYRSLLEIEKVVLWTIKVKLPDFYEALPPEDVPIRVSQKRLERERSAALDSSRR